VQQVAKGHPRQCLGFGGSVTSDPNVITEWIEGVLDDPNYRDTTEKVLRVEADERRVFLMGTLTSFDVDENLRRVGTRTPTLAPTVPTDRRNTWSSRL
jgi:hypothetical protein